MKELASTRILLYHETNHTWGCTINGVTEFDLEPHPTRSYHSVAAARKIASVLKRHKQPVRVVIL